MFLTLIVTMAFISAFFFRAVEKQHLNHLTTLNATLRYCNWPYNLSIYSSFFNCNFVLWKIVVVCDVTLWRKIEIMPYDNHDVVANVLRVWMIFNGDQRTENKNAFSVSQLLVEYYFFVCVFVKIGQ